MAHSFLLSMSGRGEGGGCWSGSGEAERRRGLRVEGVSYHGVVAQPRHDRARARVHRECRVQARPCPRRTGTAAAIRPATTSQPPPLATRRHASPSRLGNVRPCTRAFTHARASVLYRGRLGSGAAHGGAQAGGAAQRPVGLKRHADSRARGRAEPGRRRAAKLPRDDMVNYLQRAWSDRSGYRRLTGQRTPSPSSCSRGPHRRRTNAPATTAGGRVKGARMIFMGTWI